MVTKVKPDPELPEQVGSLLYGNFELASGEYSSYYFDSKKLTLNPKGAYIVGKYFFEKLKNSDARAVGGMALAAIPIVTAVTLVSYLEEKPIPAFFVRPERKGHGTLKLIEGNLPIDKSYPVAIIDDVVTTGGSILKAINAVRKEGYIISDVMCILDRNEGGREALMHNLGYDLQAMYTAVEEEPGKVKVILTL